MSQLKFSIFQCTNLKYYEIMHPIIYMWFGIEEGYPGPQTVKRKRKKRNIWVGVMWQALDNWIQQAMAHAIVWVWSEDKSFKVVWLELESSPFKGQWSSLNGSGYLLAILPQ